MAQKIGLTLKNDGEVALVVPAGITRNYLLKFGNAFVVRRNGMSQEQFLHAHPVIENAKLWLEGLCGALKTSNEEIDAALHWAHNDRSRKQLRKLIADCRERFGGAR